MSIEGLARSDAAHIHDLEHQARVDHEIIETLAGQGVIDRAEIANLQVALRSSRRIGAAIGVIMTTKQVTESQAFELLKAVSQQTHVKLRDVAEEVLYTGTLELPPS